MWADSDAALKKYGPEKDDLHAGRKPRPDTQELIVWERVNAFLNQKKAMVEVGELSALTWGDYKSACDEIVAAFGKRRLLADIGPDDFASFRDHLARKWGRTA